MSLNKNKGISTVCAIVVLIVFNLIAFLVPVTHTVTFWLGYSFATLSTLLLLTTLLILFSKKTKETKFLNLSLSNIAWIYFVLQMVLSLMQIFGIAFSYMQSLITNTILSALFLILVISAYAGISTVSESEKETSHKIFYLKEIQTDLYLLHSDNNNISIKIKELIEMVRFSDPMSHSMLRELESEIKKKCNSLKEYIGIPEMANKLCDELKLLIEERSERCKLLKSVPDPTNKADNSGIKFVVATFAVVGFTTITTLIVAFILIPYNNYKTAEQLFSAKQYSEAIEVFNNLGNFKDSKNKSEECREQINEEKYVLATDYYENNNYSEALKLFSEIQKYKDSQKIIEQIYNILSVDDEIYFGTYKDTPIAWSILKTEKGEMLLISKKPVTELAFNNDLKNITWDTSSVRQWLNNDFLDNFSKEEVDKILIVNENNIDDKVFLLSEEEYNTYSNFDFTSESDWWLRTKTDSGMMFVYGDSGKINTVGEGVIKAKGVRPCIWINLK